MESIEDPMWYRVARLRPRLRLRIRVQRRVMRGEVWYVLIDDERRRFHRVDAVAYQLVGRLDGSISVDAAWRALHQRLGDKAPTQSEALRMLTQLSDAELLTVHADADADAMLKRRRERKRGLRAAVGNPLSFKVPLVDPSALLQRVLPATRWLFSGTGLLLWLALVGAASVLALMHGPELQLSISQQARSAGFLFQMWALYPLVKLVHEACHALAVRRWGGEVHEVGINLVMFNPLPYVDASAANGFPQRHWRMAVSAAGVMAELAIAAIALFLWNASNSATVQTAALAVIAACGVSTLLFNANPLARFDGYYLMCDALDLPNLQPRGRAMLAHFAQRLIGVARADAMPETSRREAWIVTSYAVLSWLYQLLVIVTICYWLYQPYALIAIGLLLFSGWSLIASPVLRAAGSLMSDSRFNGRRLRVLATTGGVLLVAVLALFVVPAPSFTVQQGVVWTPAEATVRAEAPGELVSLFVSPNRRVEPNQAIATLDNLELRSERETAQAKWQQLDIQYFNAMLGEPLEARRLGLERDAVGVNLSRLDQQLGAMTVQAPRAGQWIVPKDTAQPGHYYRRGDEVGYILSDEPTMLVKVALTEAQAALMREHASQVTVRLAAAPQDELPATLDRETPSVTRTLPSAVLGSTAGGPIATDPDDSTGRKTLASVVMVDVRVPGHRTELIGARAWVRIDHQREPLARQWGRVLQQAFLSRLAALT